jgi:hypothetical protein
MSTPHNAVPGMRNPEAVASIAWCALYIYIYRLDNHSGLDQFLCQHFKEGANNTLKAVPSLWLSPLHFTRRRMAAAADPNWQYFYVLPNSRDNCWHDIFQQRLDRDPNAHNLVQEAIRNAMGLNSEAVQVKAICVDLFNDAYCHYHQGNFIARPKIYTEGKWKLENKRFVARIQNLPPSWLDASRIPTTISVRGVAPLHAISFDYSDYDKKKRISASAANAAPAIKLSLCWPLVFAIQASLAMKPDAVVDHAALGSAFLDIIMVCDVVTVPRHAHRLHPTYPHSCSPINGANTQRTPTLSS